MKTSFKIVFRIEHIGNDGEKTAIVPESERDFVGDVNAIEDKQVWKRAVIDMIHSLARVVS